MRTDTGTFTDAGIELGISQAAVSRNLLALENLLGARLLHRTSRSVTPSTAGVHVLAQARQILAAAANLVSEATTGHTALRIGHAWSATGRYTREFQRRWAAGHPETVRRGGRRLGAALPRRRGRRPVGTAPVRRTGRGGAAHRGDRPAHRDDDPRPLAGGRRATSGEGRAETRLRSG
jgi:DNA-binding transcriptional LysR family regulator